MAVTSRVYIIFRIIQRPEVNYSAYTTVNTPQNIVQMISEDVCQVFVIKTLLYVGLISYASNPMPPLLIPKRHFRVSNGGLSH